MSNNTDNTDKTALAVALAAVAAVFSAGFLFFAAVRIAIVHTVVYWILEIAYVLFFGKWGWLDSFLEVFIPVEGGGIAYLQWPIFGLAVLVVLLRMLFRRGETQPVSD